MGQICALMGKVVLGSFSSVLLFLSNVRVTGLNRLDYVLLLLAGRTNFLFPHFIFLLCVSACHGKQGPMKSVFS